MIVLVLVMILQVSYVIIRKVKQRISTSGTVRLRNQIFQMD